MPIKRVSKIFSFILFSCTLSACSGLLFYPDKPLVRTPEALGLTYQDILLEASDSLKIHGWFLPAQGDLKGSVYFLHGNAQNISTHVQNIAWLPQYGYQVFLIDYRGFGRSGGTPRLPEIFMDVEAGFNWLLDHADHKPLFLLGQSMGASLGIYFTATNPEVKRHLAGIASDSAFSSYFEIVRHVAASNWLTWPFQYPVASLMNYPYNPIDVIADISPVPLLLTHGRKDFVVPFSQGEQLYQAAKQPKMMIQSETGHNETFHLQVNRLNLLNFLQQHSLTQQARPSPIVKSEAGLLQKF